MASDLITESHRLHVLVFFLILVIDHVWATKNASALTTL